MKCRILFSGKNKKNISNLPSAELAYRGKELKMREFVKKRKKKLFKPMKNTYICFMVISFIL